MLKLVHNRGQLTRVTIYLAHFRTGFYPLNVYGRVFQPVQTTRHPVLLISQYRGAKRDYKSILMEFHQNMNAGTSQQPSIFCI